MTNNRFCSNCGFELVEDAKFCVKCGTKIKYFETNQKKENETINFGVSDKKNNTVLDEKYDWTLTFLYIISFIIIAIGLLSVLYDLI